MECGSLLPLAPAFVACHSARYRYPKREIYLSSWRVTLALQNSTVSKTVHSNLRTQVQEYPNGKISVPDGYTRLASFSFGKRL
jgi:hypothetical protein